jgi:hypothetical protein
MTEFSIVHEFEADPETFWRVFLDSEYNDALYRSVGVRREELSREDRGDEIVVRAHYASERQLPAVVQSLLGGRNLGYQETIIFRKRNGAVEQVIEPTVLTGRIRFGGHITIETVAPGRLRRVYAGSIAIDLPLVGKRIEQSTVSEMQRTHEQAAQVTREWLAKAAA